MTTHRLLPSTILAAAALHAAPLAAQQQHTRLEMGLDLERDRFTLNRGFPSVA